MGGEARSAPSLVNNRPVPDALTFVTVTYRAEDALLRLQARSLVQFAADGLIAKIIVIDNGTPELRGGRLRSLMRAYGPLADLVEIVRAPQLASDLGGLSGWHAQQVLKLAIARRAPTPWYVLLDAKNHAIRPLSLEDFLAPDGRARGGFHDYAKHPLHPTLLKTLAHFELPESAASWYPPTATPFVMHTQTALDIMDSLGEELRTEFAHGTFTEFFLYSAWILKRDGDWDSVYDGTAIECPTIWGGNSDAKGVRVALDLIAKRNAPFFGVHRRAMLRLRWEAFRQVEALWLRTGLMPSRLAVRRLRAASVAEFVGDSLAGRLRRAN